jgi:hypothetical protein
MKKIIFKYLEWEKKWLLWVVNESVFKHIKHVKKLWEHLIKKNNGLKWKNILWKTYKDEVDIVIPTRNIKDIKSINILNGLKWVHLNIIERKFNKKNGWFAKACNDWANMYWSISEFILFMNDDVLLDPKDIDKMKLMFTDWVWIVWWKLSKIDWWVNWSFLMIKRELFEMVWWFDENYFFMWEDNDLCENIVRRWWSIRIANTKSKHIWWDSLNTKSDIWKQNYYKWRKYFLNKWNSNRIIWVMIIWDEKEWYIKKSILDLLERKLVDEMVVVLDWSNKKTERIVRSMWVVVIKHNFKLFWNKENILRETAINYWISYNPYCFIVLDADELIDVYLTRKRIFELLEINKWIDFKIAHFWWWNKMVRVDYPFASQKNIRIFRYDRNFNIDFYNRNIHCWSAPIYAYEDRINSWMILYHYWYNSKEKIKNKIERERIHDKNKYENPKFINNIWAKPKLIKFSDCEFLKTWLEY